MVEKEQTRSPVCIHTRQRMNQCLESDQWRFTTAAKEETETQAAIELFNVVGIAP